jgi:hypothetical protein
MQPVNPGDVLCEIDTGKQVVGFEAEVRAQMMGVRFNLCGLQSMGADNAFADV